MCMCGLCARVIHAGSERRCCLSTVVSPWQQALGREKRPTPFKGHSFCLPHVYKPSHSDAHAAWMPTTRASLYSSPLPSSLLLLAEAFAPPLPLTLATQAQVMNGAGLHCLVVGGHPSAPPTDISDMLSLLPPALRLLLSLTFSNT